MRCLPFLTAIQAWNNAIEHVTERVIIATQNHLPERIRQQLFIPSLNSKKMVLHIVGTIIFLRITAGNRWISKPTGCALGALGSVATCGPLARYFRYYFKDFKSFSKMAEVTAMSINGFAYLTFLTYRTVKKTGMELYQKHRPPRLTITSSVADDTIEVIRPPRGEFTAQDYSQTFEKDIAELTSRIKRIQDLLEEDPHLKELCRKAASNYQSIFSSYQPPDTCQLDPSAPSDLMVIQGLKKNALESRLREYEIFLERHPEISAYLEDKLQKPSSSKEDDIEGVVPQE